MTWWIVAGVGVVVATALWWWLPKWEVDRLRLQIHDAKARADVEDNFRKTIGHLAALIGTGFAYYQSQPAPAPAPPDHAQHQHGHDFEAWGKTDGPDVKSDLSLYKGTVSALHNKANGGMILKRQLAVPYDQPFYPELGRSDCLGGTPMSQLDVITGSDSTPVYRVRKIGPADLKDALAKGLADFSAKPSHLVFLGLIYPLVGIGLVVGASPHLIFPLLSGFALIGPFAGIGLYEISRARELGLDTSWRHAFAVVALAFDIPNPVARPLVGGDLRVLAVRGPGSLCIAPWTRAASVLHAPQFITTIFDTPQGWKLIGFGTGIGFVFAVLALSVSVVSFPMLLDRPIDAGAEALDVGIEHPVVTPTIDVPIAIQTSVKAVLVNPFTMALWGLIVAASVPGGRFPIGVCRSRGCGARSRAFDLASLPQGRGTGRPGVIGNGAFRTFEGLTFEIGDAAGCQTDS